MQNISSVENYRQFLKLALESQFNKNGKPNLAEFSRRAGFASRSFIVDVLGGRKHLTVRSFPKVVQALKLKGDLRSFFETLVFLEEPELRPKSYKEASLQQKLQALRIRLQQKSITNNPRSKSQKLFSTKHVFTVYAALGSQEKGASLAEISERTGLSDNTILSTLDILREQGCVRFSRARYFATLVHFDIEALGENQGFLSIFKASLEQLALTADRKKNDPETLIFHSAFSVEKYRLAELKNKLEQLLFDFVTSEQVDDGNTVAKLSVGFYR